MEGDGDESAKLLWLQRLLELLLIDRSMDWLQNKSKP